MVESQCLLEVKTILSKNMLPLKSFNNKITRSVLKIFRISFELDYISFFHPLKARVCTLSVCNESLLVWIFKIMYKQKIVLNGKRQIQYVFFLIAK